MDPQKGKGSKRQERRENCKITLVIIRGPSGSGKSTLAKSHFEKKGYKAFAADDWMIDEQGEFSFCGKRLKECHTACQKNARRALQKGFDVVVHNTAITKMEIQPYYDISKGYNVVILSMANLYGSAKGVPEEVGKKHLEKYEPVSGERTVIYDKEMDKILDADSLEVIEIK